MAEEPMAKLRVLDLTHYIAGPYCTKLLAGLGAEVVKIERPDGGDPARRLGPFPDDIPDPEKSGLFLYLNTSKKGITLNLKTETGKKIFKELVKDTDVLVENFEPRVMPSLGLDYETLEKVNPRLIMTSISNFGQTGPYRDYKAQEINMAALGGIMYMTGDPEREPLKEPGSTVQFTAGGNAAAATIAACYEQKMSGSGQHVDVSILESVISLLDVYTLVWNRSRLTIKRMGNHMPASFYPGGMGGHGIYPCKDGYIGVTVMSLDNLVLIAALTGMDELADPDIGDGYARYIHRDKFEKLFMKALKNQEKEKLFCSAQENRLLWGAVRNIGEVINSTHYQERGFWIKIDHPKAGPQTYPRLPFIMSETETIMERAPLLGEHNEEIYCKRLAYSRDDLVKLRGTNVI